MSGRTNRVIGTTPESIRKAEYELGFVFPPSFRAWLQDNNGSSVDGIDRIYPVFDERDPRTTWDSITRNFKDNWLDWTGNFEGGADTFSNLLPFAEVGDGDLYCFDYNHPGLDSEVPVVRWSHETGETELRGASFTDFVGKLKEGDLIANCRAASVLPARSRGRY